MKELNEKIDKTSRIRIEIQEMAKNQITPAPIYTIEKEKLLYLKKNPKIKSNEILFSYFPLYNFENAHNYIINITFFKNKMMKTQFNFNPINPTSFIINLEENLFLQITDYLIKTEVICVGTFEQKCKLNDEWLLQELQEECQISKTFNTLHEKKGFKVVLNRSS